MRRISWRLTRRSNLMPGERRAMREGRQPTEDDIYCPFDEKDVDFTPKADFNPGTYYQSQGYPAKDGEYVQDVDLDPFAAPEEEIKPEVIIRVATIKDGRNMYLIKLIIAILLLVPSVSIAIYTAYYNISEDFFFASAATTTGIITNRELKNDNERFGFSFKYVIEYKYVVDKEFEFTGTDQITEEYAVKNNFILSSLTTDSEPEITVYYDPNDYSHSKLVHTSKSVNAIFILMIIGGASLLIVALAEIFMLKNGFYCVEQNCGKEVLRRNENVTISWR